METKITNVLEGAPRGMTEGEMEIATGQTRLYRTLEAMTRRGVLRRLHPADTGFGGVMRWQLASEARAVGVGV